MTEEQAQQIIEQLNRVIELLEQAAQPTATATFSIITKDEIKAQAGGWKTLYGLKSLEYDDQD